jgi:hypothetical protein
MKFFAVLLCLTGSLPAAGQPQHAPAKVTLLRIEGSGAFGEKQSFTVTADSVLVDKMANADGGGHRTHYARALTPTQHDDLLSPFNRVYLSTLKLSYEGRNTITDDVTFGLFIHKGEAVKYVQVYRYKLMPFYVFSQKLNRLLPRTFRLDYNESYFTN